MESIEVIARFTEQGQIEPLSYVLAGHTSQIDAIGKRWEDDAGQHFLVLVPSERVTELLFNPAVNRWYLKRLGSERLVA